MRLTEEKLEEYDKLYPQIEGDFIKVGMNTCGIAAGAIDIYNLLKEKIEVDKIPVRLVKCSCIGMCYAEPIIEIKINSDKSLLYGHLSPEIALDIFEKALKGEVSHQDLLLEQDKRQFKIVLRNCGIIDAESIDDYLENKGYQAFKKVLFDISRDDVIEELKTSGLRGRGGAGFPTWLKWNNTKSVESDEKYIICNGDEGDPGAYMDRSILEGDPHLVVEGMMIAARTIGANRGFFYIRGEYPLAIERIQNAINQCYERGLLGKDILGSGFDFDLEVRIGAGAFVCGEETALIASIEGKRGYPRPRPPYPAFKGLWDKPTVINNVETLANISYIILNGGKDFGRHGTEKSKGTKVFALTGKVKKASLAEVPMGITIREVIEDIGGGIENGNEFKAVQTGGPSGGLIPKEHFDKPISYESLKELGSIMGSGGMVVMDTSDCVVDVAKFFLEFCVDESCGKCAPCRIGSTQLLNILTRITKGRGQVSDIEKIEKICFAMQKASLCGLGQSAPNPVISGLRYFKDEYMEHIVEKKCRAGKCKALIKET